MHSPHFYHQPYYLKPRDIIERLIRMNQYYKVATQHEKTLKGQVSGEFALELINRIDYLQPWGDLQSDFAAEKTFSWLDWLVIEQGIRNDSFRVKDMTHEQMLQMASTILPDGSGIFHQLAQ